MSQSVRVVDFYRQTGQRLIDTSRYPERIAEYRRVEDDIAAQTAPFYQVVLEIGCMDGCLLYPVVRGLALTYVGVDVDAHAIQRFRARIVEEWDGTAIRHAVALDVSDVGALSELIVPRRTVAMFPFNSFGNLQSPTGALDSLGAHDVDLWIGTYQTSPSATELRRCYYDNARIGVVDHTEEDCGVLFTSAEGFKSYAYRGDFLRAQLEGRGYEVEIDDTHADFSFIHARLREAARSTEERP